MVWSSLQVPKSSKNQLDSLFDEVDGGNDDPFSFSASSKKTSPEKVSVKVIEYLH